MIKSWKKGAVVLASIAVLAAGCGQATGQGTDSETNSNGKADDQTLTVSVPASLTTIDTIQTTDKNTFTVVQHLFEGLYRLDDNSKPVPGLAAEEAEISEDGKTYTFTLKEDAKWSNGEPITAHDFVYSWTKMVTPESAAPNAYLLDSVVNGLEARTGKVSPDELGVEAVSDTEFKVELTEPLPSFLTLISIGWLAPQHEAYVEEQGESYASDSEQVLYSGPFILSNWTQGEEDWSLEKNEHYYAADEVNLTNIDFNTIKEEQTGIDLYTAQQLDLTKISGQYVDHYQNDEGFVSHNDIANTFIDFNKEEGTPAGNVHLRKAIAYAIDKESLVDTVLNDGAVALNGLIPNGLFQNPETGEDFRAYSGDYLTHDVEKAQEEWELAQEELGNIVEISLLSADDYTSARTAEYVQSQIQETLDGVTVKLNKQPKNNVNQSRGDSNYEMSLSGWIAGDNNLAYYFILYEGDSSYNYGNYHNDNFDVLVTDAKTVDANDVNQQFVDYKEAETLLIEEDAAQVPLYQGASNYLINPELKGIEYHLYGDYFNFRTAYLAEE
ncbi:peptide ABC transporter substrate-binding protein [Carnobacterium sp. CS13]|uniref:peptide ABC transporter substrate-binding protein n=1 Tax=Carnobacterium sp. CS13 TaxID=2800128 RepID=UPI001913C7B3|nr:peptide ABC transporter substrate-binding protein [Carnobacterium sp. CS13]QQP69475.1 peptide ABC transporter substrate-binding protein [Carnobacterium sp. CS13]